MNKAETMIELTKKIPKYRRELIAKTFQKHRIDFDRLLVKKRGYKSNYVAMRESGLKDVLLPFIPEYEPLLKRKFSEQERILMSNAFDGLFNVFQSKTIAGMINQLIGAIHELATHKELRIYTPDIKIKPDERYTAKKITDTFIAMLMINYSDVLIKAGDEKTIPSNYWNNLLEDEEIYMPDDLIEILIKTVESKEADKNFVKVSAHLENQKPGRQLDTQTSLFDLFENEKNKSENIAKIAEHSINSVGLDLSKAENKALFALQTILADSDFKGNTDPHQWESGMNPWLNGDIDDIKSLPQALFTPAEYYTRYGVSKFKTGRGKMEFSRAESIEALKALYLLATRNHLIVYERRFEPHKSKTGEKIQKVQRIETVQPMIRIFVGSEEVQRLATGEKVTTGDSLKFIAIRYLPLFFDQIGSFYILKPANLHQEVKDRFPKSSKFLIRLLDELYLQAKILGDHNKPLIIETTYEKLAERLRMESYIKTRQKGKIRSTLNTIYEQARDMGFLSDYQIDVKGKTTIKDILHLNPERYITKKPREERELPKKSRSLQILTEATKKGK